MWPVDGESTVITLSLPLPRDLFCLIGCGVEGGRGGGFSLFFFLPPFSSFPMCVGFTFGSLSTTAFNPVDALVLCMICSGSVGLAGSSVCMARGFLDVEVVMRSD